MAPIAKCCIQMILNGLFGRIPVVIDHKSIKTDCNLFLQNV